MAKGTLACVSMGKGTLWTLGARWQWCRCRDQGTEWVSALWHTANGRVLRVEISDGGCWRLN